MYRKNVRESNLGPLHRRPICYQRVEYLRYKSVDAIHSGYPLEHPGVGRPGPKVILSAQTTNKSRNEHKQQEIYMANARILRWGPTLPIFHLFTLGVCFGGNVNFSVCDGGNANFSIFRYQPVGIPNALGVLPKVTAQRECFCIPVEYRLISVQRGCQFLIWLS